MAPIALLRNAGHVAAVLAAVVLATIAPRSFAGSYPSSYIPTTTSAVSVATTQSSNPADVGQFTFTRAAGKYAPTSSGSLVWFPSGVPAITDLGISIEGAGTNKSTNTNLNPQTLSGMTVVTGSGTLSLVDDSAELARIGLSGNVYKIDNTGNATEMQVNISGQVGTLNPQTTSLYWRGSGTARYGLTSGFGSAEAVPTHYARVSKTQTADNTTRQTGVGVQPGAVVYFILNQLEEASFASSPIPVAGASATRPADVASYGGLSLPSAYTFGAEALMGVSTPSANQDLAEIHDGTTNNRLVLFRNTSDAYQASAVSGGTSVARSAGLASGPRTLRLIANVTGTTFSSTYDGNTPVAASAASAPVSPTILTIGSDRGVGAWLGGSVGKVTLYPYAANDNEEAWRSAGNW